MALAEAAGPTEVVEISRDDLRRVSEKLGREIYGIATFDELMRLFAAGRLEDRPGAGHLHSVLEMAS